MNLDQTFQRKNEADYSTIADLQRRMEKLLDDLDQHAPAYSSARQIQEFSSDRRKSALADAFAAILANDPEASATAAEHRARASKGYKDRMQELQRDYLCAENAITLYNLLSTRLDVARSLLAIERVKLERGT